MSKKLQLLNLIFGMTSFLVYQDCHANNMDLMILGKKESTILGRVVTLGDISDVTSNKIADDQSIIALRKIAIQNSPLPGESTTISAARVLEILDKAGVDRKTIGYSFPRIMTIARASRLLGKDEVRDAITRALSKRKSEIIVKNVFFDQEINVSPGLSVVKAIPLNSNRNRYTFNIKVSVEGEEDVKFTVPAEIEEWVKLPVATRPMSKGEVVRSDDLAMARLNLDAIPQDAALNERMVVGYELNNHISAGDAFRRKALKIPPVVNANSKVTLLFTKGPLTATATGTALEAGIEGQLIRVQNDSSRRVIMAHIVEPGLVKVEVQ